MSAVRQPVASLKRTTIYLEPEIRARLDRFCDRSRRSLTNAVNALVDCALRAWEADLDVDTDQPQH